MALPAFAVIADLNARMGENFEDDDPRALAALDDASSVIRDAAGKSWVNDSGDLDLPTDPSSTVADTLRRVCCSAARRVLENPDGVAQEGIGSYSVGYSNSSNDVYLTKAEVRAVRRAAGKSGLQAIPTTRGLVGASGVFGGLETARCDRVGYAETTYLPVDPDGKDMPFTGPDGY